MSSNQSILDAGMVHIEVPFASLDEQSLVPKQSLLEELGITATSFEITLRDGLPRELILAARVYHLDAVEVYFARTPSQSLMEHIGGHVSPQNELRTLVFFTKEVAKIEDDALRLAAQSRLDTLVAEYSKNVPISPMSEPLQDERSVALMQWAEAQGVISHVELADFKDTGRGMALKSSIGANEPLIECDVGLFISIFAARRSKVLGPIFEQLPELDEDTILILFVIYEKFANPDSFWKPYLDLLPETIDSGLFFDATEQSYAAGTTLDQEIAMTIEQFVSVHKNIMELVKPFEDVFSAETFSLERFLWARAMFDSRGFNLNIQGVARNCLLPFIDSINTMHYSHLQNRGRIEENRPGQISDLGTYVLPSLSPCSFIGNQVFLNYGGFSTRELVLFYGFTYEGEHNPYDSWNLDLDIPDNDNAEARLQLAATLNITNDHYLMAHRISNDLLCYLSILVLPAEEIPTAITLKPSALRNFLLHNTRMPLIVDSLEALVEQLKDSLLSQNEFLSRSENNICFPSNRAKLAFLYAKAQLHILESNALMLQSLAQK